MKKRTRLFNNLLIIVILFLSACNLPSSNTTNDAAGTAAAQTVQALLSATTILGAVTPSFTPGLPAPAILTPTPPIVSTNTPIPTATTYCNAMQFVTDVTYPDGTVVAPGAAFTKTWRLKNVGTCAWTPSYTVVFSDGNSMSGPSTQALVGNVNPGQTIDISVNFTAPTTPGDYTGNWRIRDASGILFGKFYVQIKVQGPATATFTALPLTATYTSTPVFAVTNVTFNVTGACPNLSFIYSVTTNAAGTVNLHRIFSDGGTDSTPVTMTFGAAGTQTSPANPVFTGAGTTKWIDIYIDSPNHQQFGRANFSCP